MSFSIESFLSLDGYATEERVSRRKGGGVNSQEFFTPYDIVKRMCDKISEDDWADPTKTFCDPCFGNGQITIYIIWNRLQHGVDWKTTLETLYGVELMSDNVEETKQRVLDLFDALEIDYDKEIAQSILDVHLVCSDFFKWDFEQWCPLQ